MTNNNINDTTNTATLSIIGMSCGGCSSRIDGVLGETVGIHQVKIDLAEKKGIFDYDPAIISAEQIISTIEDMGFDVSLDEA